MDVMNLPLILDRSLDILRKYFKSILAYTLLYGLILIAMIIPVAVIAGITFAVSAGMGAAFGSASGLTVNGIVMLIVFIGGIVLIFLGLFLSYYVGLIKIAAQEFEESTVTSKDAIKASFRSIPRVFGLCFIIFIISLPLLAVIGLTIYLLVAGTGIAEYISGNIGGFILSPGMQTINAALMIIVFYFVAIIAIIFLYSIYLNFFTFAFQVLVLEEAGIIESLKRSFRLVRNCFWRIYGCNIIIYLTTAVFSYSVLTLFGMAGGLIYLLMSFASIPPDAATFFIMLLNSANWPINLVTWFVITPLAIIMPTILYFSRKYKVQGYDLSKRLLAIESAQLAHENEAASLAHVQEEKDFQVAHEQVEKGFKPNTTAKQT